ncbi:MAG TPA: sigma-70 family RNA polymerase sigma factor [Tepidisphaeraceae bacterium]|jgi:RNA polymerase sigma factor (sigma-70 family)
MSGSGGLSDADRYLLERVRRQDGEAWSQLVGRYQGRLLAFARGRHVKEADAEDFVQDTFLKFLRGVEQFRGEASIETFLFLLLRRRIADSLRGRRVPACGASDPDTVIEDGGAPADDSASFYARRDERLSQERAALAKAIMGLVEGLREERNFRDLQLAEMLFYAQMRNNAIGHVMGLDEKYVGLLKHRWIKQLRGQIERVLKPVSGTAVETETRQESILSEIWEEHRPSCPKRTTLGGYVLGTLDEPWRQYVQFHLERLGCRFCAANLDDLRRETADESHRLRERVMQSTVGFFRRP